AKRRLLKKMGGIEAELLRYLDCGLFHGGTFDRPPAPRQAVREFLSICAFAGSSASAGGPDNSVLPLRCCARDEVRPSAASRSSLHTAQRSVRARLSLAARRASTHCRVSQPDRCLLLD